MEKNKHAVKWGTQGGKATLKKKGKKHFKAMAKLKWEKYKADKKRLSTE